MSEEKREGKLRFFSELNIITRKSPTFFKYKKWNFLRILGYLTISLYHFHPLYVHIGGKNKTLKQKTPIELTKSIKYEIQEGSSVPLIYI